MFAAIHVPRPSLQALLAANAAHRFQPSAVLDAPEKVTTSQRERGKLRVVEISSEAGEFGIYPGMTATQAQARCDGIILLNRSAKSESRLTEALLDLAGQFTPDFEDSSLGSCLLDLRGVPDMGSVARQLYARLRSKDYEPCIGLSSHPDLAELAARAAAFYPGGDGRDADASILVLDESRLGEVLGPLPLRLLDLEPDKLELFDLWGIRSIGDFTALGRADLVERLGEEVGQLRDRATGRSRRLLRLVRPDPTFLAREELDYEITTTEPLLFLMRRHLEIIASRLRSCYLVAERLSLRLELATGGVHQRIFRIPEPCANVDIWASMLQIHLEGYESAAAISGFELGASPARPGRHQFDLFGAGLKDPNRLSETLARVEAILGAERCGVPRLRPGHYPDSFAIGPFRPEREPAALADVFGMEMPCLPMKRFRPRRHVQVKLEKPENAGGKQGTMAQATGYDGENGTRVPEERPRPAVILSGDFKGCLTAWRGPFSSSGNWWEKRTFWRREEWDVLHENGRFYRLTCEFQEWFIEAEG